MAAHVVELLGHGVGDGGAHAAPHHGHPLQALGLGGPAQGAHEILEGIPLLLVVELFGGGPHHLVDDGDGAGLPVKIGDGQGDALPLPVHPEDDELAGLGLAGHGGGLDLHQGHGGIEHPFFHDPIHSFSSFLWISAPPQSGTPWADCEYYNTISPPRQFYSPGNRPGNPPYLPKKED